ncbi:hypothetical protein Cob_v000030 [Colletotrichum orbiculare MAFF 240422]|uniref:EC34 protein n=1 Tax=Colletotrichum orbiculare (strain 104-T / ATCC 96160 / CBS 514.97 / LARS 414 / MAFF 240422) TaxID=1213857 RepID=N4V0X4_COLOR|nr:hypothetical protein Cob_v000030 [Colletotrichum orbiculare MAFF 240422]
MQFQTAVVALFSMVAAVSAAPQTGFNCQAQGFCTTSDPNCNFCLNIAKSSYLSVCQAIDPNYKSTVGDISSAPAGSDFQCIITCCH